ncbi:MAG TPA: glucosamine-6-phosphate deaminase [Kiritimatiellia bacterium]|nr:glucosamine-6-phosphate deaminase [Kiritimatiellia bacterium]HRU71608.1 glucosamine-6-phosphate deaminase [Kiritimatiellia bacterium]
MTVHVSKDSDEMARAAAADAAAALKQAVEERGEARLIVATGASQFGFLQALTQAPGIAWPQITAFHLDEYVGLPAAHRASFRAYLRQRFVGALPTPLRAFVEVDGEAADLAAECDRLKQWIDAAPIDVACVGIGENGHLAFNDPPADFEAEAAYLVVTLDEACRRQQVGEGWFASLDEVPKQALSMSIPQIMKSRHIVCTVPDARKAEAVRGAVEGPVTPLCPASVLQRHPSCALYLDSASASALRR